MTLPYHIIQLTESSEDAGESVAFDPPHIKVESGTVVVWQTKALSLPHNLCVSEPQDKEFSSAAVAGAGARGVSRGALPGQETR